MATHTLAANNAGRPSLALSRDGNSAYVGIYSGNDAGDDFHLLSVGLHNKPAPIFPFDDLEELLPSGFIETLRKEGVQVGDPTKLEDFISTEKGRRRLEVYQRYFSVKFRNGTVKRVQPEARRAQYTVSKKMAAMRKKIADQE